MVLDQLSSRPLQLYSWDTVLFSHRIIGALYSTVVSRHCRTLSIYPFIITLSTSYKAHRAHPLYIAYPYLASSASTLNTLQPKEGVESIV